MRLALSLRCFLISDQLLQVLNQVVQLRHLDVVLNDVARIQEANRLNVLLNRLIVLLLLEEFVGVLLNDLTLDLTWEVCLFSDGLSFSIVAFLHQVVNLDVILHRVQFDELTIDALPLVAL